MDENIFGSSEAVLSKKTLVAILVISLVTVGIIGVSTAFGEDAPPEERLPIAWEDLVARWNFNDDSSADVWDVSTETNDGTMINMYLDDYVGSPIALTGQEESQALDFDGEGDYVEIDSPQNLPTSPPFTVTAWILNRDLNYRCDTILYIGDMHNSFELNTSWFGDKLRFFQRGKGTNFVGNTSMKENIWYFATVTVDSNNKGTLYLNGTQDGSSSNMDMSSPPQKARIGKEGGYGYYWNGEIDEVRIYERALTDNEIEGIYNRTRPK